ncbi:MAG: hypothetical protein J2P30_22240 [Actinobacteria bacterium]|nr:hypothetical protein [Actinomycetota bacterium]
MLEHIELPRPWRLLRTAAVSFGESFGVPVGAFLIVDAVAGEHPGLIAGLAATWFVALARKLVTGAVPGLVLISVVLLTLQTGLAFVTGQTWIYLLQVPLAKFLLCLVFARTAPTTSPIVGRLAGEVVALPTVWITHDDLHRFFRGATWLWAVIFGLLSLLLTGMVVTQPLETAVLASTFGSIALAVLGAGICIVWFRRTIRRLGLTLRFTAVA